MRVPSRSELQKESQRKIDQKSNDNKKEETNCLMEQENKDPS